MSFPMSDPELVFLPEDPRTCHWCLGADGWWEDYTVNPAEDTEPDQGLLCGENVYEMWMPCPRCSSVTQLELPHVGP